MDSDPGTIKEMHEEEGCEKVKKLQKEIDITKYNMEVFLETLSETSSDAQKEKLIEKNRWCQHGIADLEKEIRDIEEVLGKQEQRKRSHVGASASPWLFVIARFMSVDGLPLVVTSLSVIDALSHYLAAFHFSPMDFFGADLTVFHHSITSSIEFTVDSMLFRVENKY